MIASRLATSSGRSTPCTLWSTTTTCKSVPAMQTRLESRRKLHRWRRYTPADHSCCPPSLHAGLVPASSPGSAMHIAQYHAVPPTHLHAVPILQHLELLQVLHHLQAQGRGAGRAARQGSQAGQPGRAGIRVVWYGLSTRAYCRCPKRHRGSSQTWSDPVEAAPQKATTRTARTALCPHLQRGGRHSAVFAKELPVVALQPQVQQVGLVVPGAGVAPAAAHGREAERWSVNGAG